MKFLLLSIDKKALHIKKLDDGNVQLTLDGEPFVVNPFGARLLQSFMAKVIE